MVVGRAAELKPIRGEFEKADSHDDKIKKDQESTLPRWLVCRDGLNP